MSAADTPRSAEDILALLAAQGAEPKPGLTRYRATAIERSSYRLIIDADSEEDAEDLAHEIWRELGGNCWSFKECDLDGILIDKF